MWTEKKTWKLTFEPSRFLWLQKWAISVRKHVIEILNVISRFHQHHCHRLMSPFVWNRVVPSAFSLILLTPQMQSNPSYPSYNMTHISIQITIKLSWILKSFLSLYLTFFFFHSMSAHQHLRHFYEYLWRLELEFRIEKTVSQRDSSIHPLSTPLCPPRSETVFVILA